VVAQRNPQIRKAVVKLRELSADERARDMFERREKGRRDAADREKGVLKKQALEIAQRLLERKRPIDEIIEVTGLTCEEVEALIKTEQT